MDRRSMSKQGENPQQPMHLPVPQVKGSVCKDGCVYRLIF